MGRLVRAATRKNKKIESRKNLFDQITKKKVVKTKKAKHIEKPAVNKSSSNPKLAKRIVDLAKKQNYELKQSKDFQNDENSLLKMSYLIDNVELDHESESQPEEDDNFYDQFIETQIKDEEIYKEFSEALKHEKFTKCASAQPIECNLVGILMSKYRSGPVPKALKVVPIISYWKECLSIMDPLKWSAASLKKVSKYFVASAKPHALCIATHKPSVFFRAIVFPLCLDKDCCLKEAVIFSSILSRCSFPAIHAAVAIAKIASFPHS
ncbi:hypothetical protein MXB_4084, partial [Myxobolus squamalis]